VPAGSVNVGRLTADDSASATAHPRHTGVSKLSGTARFGFVPSVTVTSVSSSSVQRRPLSVRSVRMLDEMGIGELAAVRPRSRAPRPHRPLGGQHSPVELVGPQRRGRYCGLTGSVTVGGHSPRGGPLGVAGRRA
jgi:hypothetical protein